MNNTESKSICVYFQLHQPYRLSDCSFFADDVTHSMFDGPAGYRNEDVFNKVADKCYIPATELFLELLHNHPDFHVSYSLSGVFIEQCEQFKGKGHYILELFEKMIDTGRVEILSETYYHSLAFLYSKLEYAEHIHLHAQKIHERFGVCPRVFRNTELIYSNELAEFVRNMGFQGILAEGWDPHLGAKEPQYIRSARKVKIHPDEERIARQFAVSRKPKDTLPVLLKNYKLSDDVAFRFGNKGWAEYPLTAEKYAHWLSAMEGDTINLFMDYETIGEHQWEDTGIFDFFRALPEEVAKYNIGFHTPIQAIAKHSMHGVYDVPHFVSWADSERDLSAWAENEIQSSAIEALSHFEQQLHPLKESKSSEIRELLHEYRKLQTSDHLYYMCTKYWSDGDVHKYFSPYESPYEAYITFMNSLRLLTRRLEQCTQPLTTKKYA